MTSNKKLVTRTWSADPSDRHQKGPSRATRRRLFRRAFCFPCDRWTLRRHRHCDETFSALVAREVHG